MTDPSNMLTVIMTYVVPLAAITSAGVTAWMAVETVKWPNRPP